jgi:CheY-like chemotaxis protein
VQEAELTDNYPSLNGLKILIVDDEVSVLEATQNLLEEMGCTVQTAENTPEAMAVVRQERPDIAILDYRLRGNDGGLETYERLREVSPGIPTLIVSGETAPDRLKKVKTAGLTLLTKPVDKDLLYETILAECRR